MLNATLNHRLTSSEDYELQVDMWDQDDIYAVARYGAFAISDETDNHRLHIGGYMPPQVGISSSSRQFESSRYMDYRGGTDLELLDS